MYPGFKGIYVRDLQEGKDYFKDFDSLIKFTASNGVNSYIKKDEDCLLEEDLHRFALVTFFIMNLILNYNVLEMKKKVIQQCSLFFILVIVIKKQMMYLIF